MFRAVSSMYFRPKDLHPSGSSVWVNGEYDQTEYPSLDMLLSPLRKTTPLGIDDAGSDVNWCIDNWSPKEIALFEAGMCKCGKDFHAVSKLVRLPSPVTAHCSL